MRGEIRGISNVSAIASMKSNLSIRHLTSAKHFAALCAEIELTHPTIEVLPEDKNELHYAFVTGSIFAIVSFLEAHINEFFLDAVDAKNGSQNALTSLLKPVKINRLDKEWCYSNFPRSSTINKYNSALKLTVNKKIDRGKDQTKNVQNLIELRNALVHYKSEWEPNGNPGQKTISQKLEKGLNGKFKNNPYTNDGNPFFPSKCISADCAKWAINSSLVFCNHFRTMIGLSPL